MDGNGQKLDGSSLGTNDKQGNELGGAPATPTSLNVAPPTAPAASNPAVSMPYVGEVQTGAQTAPAFTSGPTPRRRSGRKVVIASVIAGAIAVLAGGASAAYLGYMVPNKPENIWKTALSRTADGYDKLVSYTNQNKDLKGVSVQGTYKATGDFVTDGTLSMKSYDKDMTFKADMGVFASRVTIEGRTVSSANSTNPDIYLKATGIRGFGSLIGSEYGEMLDSFDGKWLAIDHTALDNLESSATNSASSTASISALTAADAVAIERAVGQANREYIFTTDQNKAVLTAATSTATKETKDGRSVYHYKVGVNKQHLKGYVNALASKLQNTPLAKVTGGKSVSEFIDTKAMLKAVDGIDASYKADVYVDLGTKLVRTVKLTDPKDTATYYQFDIPYTGGDAIPFDITIATRMDDSKTSPLGTLNIETLTNMAANKTNVNLSFSIPASGSSSKGETISAKLTIAPNNTKVDVTKPTGAKSLTEILSAFFMGVTSEQTTTPSATDYNSLLDGALSR